MNENAKMTAYEELEMKKKAIEEEQRKIKNELLDVYVNHLKVSGDFNDFLLKHSHSEIRRFADLAISSISKFEKMLKKEQQEIEKLSTAEELKNRMLGNVTE